MSDTTSSGRERGVASPPVPAAGVATGDSGPVDFVRPKARGPGPNPDLSGERPLPRRDSMADLDQAVAASEHGSDILRLRKAAVVGLAAWLGFFLVDVLVFTVIEPGPPWLFVALRLLGAILIGAIALRLRRDPAPSPRQLRTMDLVAYTSVSALISVSCLHFRGIESPFALGIVTTMVMRGVTMADPWKKGIAPVGAIGLAYPISLLLLAPISPLIAAQLAEPRALATFALNLSFIAGAGVLVILGGNLVWRLRRQVFEARAMGRYKLVRRIGVGGMGEVWRAHHQGLKRDVALKILKRDPKLGTEARARFEREVKLTTQLTHPNTVRVFDYGVTPDGLLYYAMELLDGVSLEDLVRFEGPIAPRRAFELVLQAARALSEAHKLGVVHRDLKPDNLFVTNVGGEGDFIKVLDFGVATTMTGDSGLTRPGFAVGTPSYFAPEMVAGKPADPRSDVYALGCVLYFLLTGRPPFVGKDMREVLLAHLKQAPVPPSERMNRRLPKDMESIVMHALGKDPACRHQNAGELALALSNCLERRNARIMAAVDPSLTAS